VLAVCGDLHHQRTGTDLCIGENFGQIDHRFIAHHDYLTFDEFPLGSAKGYVESFFSMR
jgi:hypothetical protein